jgi:hypothetical protein
MTVIVGIATDTHMYIGGDRGASDKKYIESMLEPKIRKNNQYLMGYAGDIGMGQMIIYEFDTPETADHSEMHTIFLPQLRTFVKDSGLELGGEEDDACNLMIMAHGRAYTVNIQDFQLLPFTTTSIGSGAGVALGSLYSDTSKSPIRRINNAIDAACLYLTSCQGPADVLSIAY